MATEPKITKLKPGEGARDFKPKQGGKGKGKGYNRGTPGGQTRTQNPCILSDGSVDPACKKVYQRSVAGRQTMQQFISENLSRGSTLKDVANAAVSGLMNRRLGYVGAYLDSNNPSRTYTRPQAVAIVSSVMGKMGYDDIWSGETGKKGDRIKTAGSAGSSVNQQRKQPGGRGGGQGMPESWAKPGKAEGASSPIEKPKQREVKPSRAPKTDLQQTLDDYRRGKLSKEDLADKLKNRLEEGGKPVKPLPLPGSAAAAKRDEGIARRKEAESAARTEARRARAEERGGQPAAGREEGRGEDKSVSSVFSSDFEKSVLGAAADDAVGSITRGKPEEEWDEDVYDYINEIKDDQIIPEIIQTLIDKKKIDKDQKSIDAAKKYLDWYISNVILGGEEEEDNQQQQQRPGETRPPAEEESGAAPQPGETQPPAEEETGAPPQPGKEPSPRKFGSQKLRDRAIKAKGEKELEKTQRVNELLGRMANSPFAQEDEKKRKFIEDDLLPKLLEEVRKDQPQPKEEPSQPTETAPVRRPPTDRGLGRITNAPGKGGGGKGFAGSFTPTSKGVKKEPPAPGGKPGQLDLLGGRGYETSQEDNPLEDKEDKYAKYRGPKAEPRQAAQPPADARQPGAEGQQRLFRQSKGKQEKYEPPANLNRVPKAYQSSAKTAPAPQPDETAPAGKTRVQRSAPEEEGKRGKSAGIMPPKGAQAKAKVEPSKAAKPQAKEESPKKKPIRDAVARQILRAMDRDREAGGIIKHLGLAEQDINNQISYEEFRDSIRSLMRS